MTRVPFREEQPVATAIGDPATEGLQRLLRIAATRGDSTLYLSSESRPSVRLDGELQLLDSEPVLTALDAHVTIAGPNAKRELPLADLYAGYYETVLDKNELITDVTVPSPNGRKAAYLKVTSRSADDWPALSVAVSFDLKADAIDHPIVVVSAATEKVTRMPEAERVLQGAPPDDATLKRAGDAATDEAGVLADAHGSAPYKRELLRVYLGRAVRRALSRGAGLQ